MREDEVSWARGCRGVMQTAFAEAATAHAWLSGVLEALEPLFGRGRAIAGTVVAKEPHGFVVDARLARGGSEAFGRSPWLDALLPRTEEAMGELCLSGRPLTSLSELRGLAQPNVHDGRLAPFDDATVFVGHAACHAAVVILAEGNARDWSPHQLRDLARLALYVETGLRLHLRRTHPARVARLSERIVRARRADRASDIVGADGDDFDLWEAVACGTHSVVERRAPDGSCSFLALENPGVARAYRALSMRDAAVARLVGRGHSGKSAAYALRTSQAVVSTALGDVAARIGLPSRTSVATFVGAALAREAVRAHEPLTQAELAVLELVRGGCSNAEIALRRGTSARTIANQVASLLRKTKAPSRRALAAIAAHASSPV